MSSREKAASSAGGGGHRSERRTHTRVRARTHTPGGGQPPQMVAKASAPDSARLHGLLQQTQGALGLKRSKPRCFCADISTDLVRCLCARPSAGKLEVKQLEFRGAGD